MLSFFLTALFIFAAPSLNAEQTPPKQGTLIVTYRTDDKGERLGRIRFWLKNKELTKFQLFPRENAFVEDLNTPSRMVVVNSLPEGFYTLEFLVPNKDRYFQKTLPKEIFIAGGEVIKVDQQIKPYSTEKEDEADADQSEQELPTTAPAEEVKQKEVNALDPPPLQEEQKSPVGFGKLILSYNLDKDELPSSIESIRFFLIDTSGKKISHPEEGKDTEVSLNSGKMVMIPAIAEGEYAIEFYPEGKEDLILHKVSGVFIEKGATKSIHERLHIGT